MKKRIMIVDDEGDIRRETQNALEEAGYELVLVTSGDECLAKLKKTNVDLILMDVIMPGTPAIKIVQQIKNIKIIYYSVVSVTSEDTEKIISEGQVLGFIQKPCPRENLVRKIEEVLK